MSAQIRYRESMSNAEYIVLTMTGYLKTALDLKHDIYKTRFMQKAKENSLI